MLELIIVLLVGASCDYLPFYQSEMPDLLVACAGENTLYGAMAVYGTLSAHGWQVVYVVDERSMLPPDKLPINGIAYYTLDYAVAYRYTHVIIHELAHLLCNGCGHDERFEWYVARLEAMRPA